MLTIIHKKPTLLAVCLVYCIINVKTIAADYKMARTNYEAIYQLRLKWAIEDLNKDINNLIANLNNLKEKENHISDTIERLKKEKFLSYHLYKVFGTLYSKPRLIGPGPFPSLWNLEEKVRFITAYGLLPITAPLAAGYVATEWLSKKNNDDIIAKLKNDQQEINTEIKKIQLKNDHEIATIEEIITKLKTEATELKELDNFIATYKPNSYLKPIWTTSPNSTSP